MTEKHFRILWKGKTLGPYSAGEVKSMLRSRELGIWAEISEKNGPWMPIGQWERGRNSYSDSPSGQHPKESPEAESFEESHQTKKPVPRASVTKPLSSICILSAVFAVLGFFPLIFLGGIAGIVLGIIGLTTVRKPESQCRGEGWAMTGLVLGCMVVLFWGAIFLVQEPVYDSRQKEDSDRSTTDAAAAIEIVVDRGMQIWMETESLAEIPVRMRRIDLSATPNEFREAYVSHIHAWESLVEVEREANAITKHYSSGDAMVEAFLRGLMGDPFGKAAEGMFEQQWIQEKFEVALYNIVQTYKQLERVAAKYGADIPDGA